jgi:hypothetical protein
VWLPFVDAYEAGLWLFWVLEREVIAVPRPALHLAGEQLHREDGPAIWWPDGARYFFWRGVQVPSKVIETPAALRPAEIRDERNAEVRRVMLERFGTERFIRECGAERVHVDEYGSLWRAELAGDEALVMVEVVNSSPEPDGSFKNYWLRVPPSIRTARGAVAWTFGMEPRDYRPRVQT